MDAISLAIRQEFTETHRRYLGNHSQCPQTWRSSIEISLAGAGRIAWPSVNKTVRCLTDRFRNLPDDLGRVPCNYAIRRDIFSDNASCSNNRMFTNFTRPNHQCVTRNPCSTFNDDIISRTRYTLLPRLVELREVVSARQKCDVVSEKCILLNGNFSRSNIKQRILNLG